MSEAATAMSGSQERGDAAARRSRTTTILLAALALGGVIAFGTGAFGATPLRAWQIYLVNLLFFMGIAQAGAVFLAILTLTQSRWGRPLERFAAAMTTFLPVAFLLFLLLPFGQTVIFSWVREPIPEKALWLNFTFLMARDGVGLAILFSLSAAVVYQYVRPLAWTLRHTTSDWRERVYALLSYRFRDMETEIARCRERTPPLALGLVAVYWFVFSLIAGDLIMSLDPHWYSTLLGAYNFVLAIYTGLAALAVLALWGRSQLGLERTLTVDRLHDMGKVIFAFALISGDFFWSQFVVIWYGNLPEETSFIARRLHHQPWTTLSWIVLYGLFALPFVLLLARAPKRNPRALAAICGLILIAGWTERYLLIVPSLTQPEDAAFGALEIFITLGFLAAFLLCYRLFIAAFPPTVAAPVAGTEPAKLPQG